MHTCRQTPLKMPCLQMVADSQSPGPAFQCYVHHAVSAMLHDAPAHQSHMSILYLHVNRVTLPISPEASSCKASSAALRPSFLSLLMHSLSQQCHALCHLTTSQKDSPLFHYCCCSSMTRAPGMLQHKWQPSSSLTVHAIIKHTCTRNQAMQNPAICWFLLEMTDTGTAMQHSSAEQNVYDC